MPALVRSGPCRLAGVDRGVAVLTGPDPDRVFDRKDEDLAVTDLARLAGFLEGEDDLLGLVVRDDDFELELGEEVDDVLRTAVELRVALLSAEALDLGHSQAFDAHTAFWTQGPNMSNSDPADGTAHDGAEIDIFESAWFGDYTKSVVHIDGYDADHRANTKQYSTPGIHSGFHTFGMEWTETVAMRPSLRTKGVPSPTLASAAPAISVIAPATNAPAAEVRPIPSIIFKRFPSGQDSFHQAKN